MLKVESLSKRYDKFELKNASFSLEEGYIMGFIGRNGAGKTTTMKSMLGLVKPDSGRVEICGLDFSENELECRRLVGVVFGKMESFPKKKLSAIVDVVSKFYSAWDAAQFASYAEAFELDTDKRIDQLSDGMRVKFSLALALSHGARVLILDEPTSGLDPVSRDDLMQVFRKVVEDGKHSILFSTHITSDLEKCADYITYIKDGSVIFSMDRETLADEYREVRGSEAQLTPEISKVLIGCRKNAFGFGAMIKSSDLSVCRGLETAAANIESIMLHLEREDNPGRTE